MVKLLQAVSQQMLINRTKTITNDFHIFRIFIHFNPKRIQNTCLNTINKIIIAWAQLPNCTVYHIAEFFYLILVTQSFLTKAQCLWEIFKECLFWVFCYCKRITKTCCLFMIKLTCMFSISVKLMAIEEKEWFYRLNKIIICNTSKCPHV